MSRHYGLDGLMSNDESGIDGTERMLTRGGRERRRMYFSIWWFDAVTGIKKPDYLRLSQSALICADYPATRHRT